jgi:hypothetical protein
MHLSAISPTNTVLTYEPGEHYSLFIPQKSNESEVAVSTFWLISRQLIKFDLANC